MRGRIPKPDALKELQGGAGHRKDDGKAQVEMPEGTPDAPAHLSPGARQEWFRTVRWLMQVRGLLSPTDHAAIGIYCSYYDQWQQAEQELPVLREQLLQLDQSLCPGFPALGDRRRTGARGEPGTNTGRAAARNGAKLSKDERAELEKRRGQIINAINSAIGERNKARKEMRPYLSEMGLTPAARSRIRVDSKQLALPLGGHDREEDALTLARRQLTGA